MAAAPAGLWLATRPRSRVWRAVALVTLVYTILAVDLALLPIPFEAIGTYAASWDLEALCDFSCNAIPTWTIRMQLRQLGDPDVVRQLLGNVALLLPLGIALPMLWPRFRRWPLALLSVAVLGASLELAQLLIDLGLGAMVRSLDIDDALLNGLGVALGFMVWAVAARFGPRARVRPERPVGPT